MEADCWETELFEEKGVVIYESNHCWRRSRRDVYKRQVFTDNSDYARATGLWQWDYGQRLRIEGLKLPTAVEIHFALTEQSGDAIPRVGTTKDSVTEVVIPDSMLENQAAGATYEIYAWTVSYTHLDVYKRQYRY